jgi:serine/threonine protein kinase
LLASLNHPNIAAIHGLEESDGTYFLVLELIEGDTLADRAKSGPIHVEEALKLALHKRYYSGGWQLASRGSFLSKGFCFERRPLQAILRAFAPWYDYLEDFGLESGLRNP